MDLNRGSGVTSDCNNVKIWPNIKVSKCWNIFRNMKDQELIPEVHQSEVE